MRKFSSFNLFAIAFITLFFCLSISPVAIAQQKITLSVASHWPATNFVQTDQYPRYFKMVEKAAKGKYAFDLKWYPAESLLKGADIYDGVAKKIADTGIQSLGYMPGRFPAMLTLSQSGFAPVNTCSAAAHTAWEFFKKYKPKELDDTKVLIFYGTGPGLIHTHKPIRKVEDLKGVRLRVTGAGALGAKAVGAEPVAMGMIDVYLAAKKGTIDGLVSPAETLKNYKHAEVFQYSTFAPFFYSELMAFVMNKSVWEKLPKDLQDAFDAVSEDAVDEAGQIWQYETELAMDYAKKQAGGHEFIYMSDEEVARLKKLLEPVKEQYIATLNSKGLPGKEMVENAQKISEKYNKQTYKAWKP
jgi:TRAP-type C4-dicarboxylate transport system substrate-binding protein